MQLEKEELVEGRSLQLQHTRFCASRTLELDLQVSYIGVQYNMRSGDYDTVSYGMFMYDAPKMDHFYRRLSSETSFFIGQSVRYCKLV